MYRTDRYRSFTLFDRIALLVSVFLVALVFLCFAFLIVPRPFYQLLLPFVVYETTGTTITFQRVEVPSYFQPHFQNLTIRMPGAPAFFSRRLVMHFDPDRVYEPTQFITKLVANDVTVESITGVTLQRATLIPLPMPTRGLAFKGVVKTKGFGNARIDGTMRGTRETFIDVNLDTKALSLRSLAGRWGLPDVVNGTASAKLSVSGRRKENELWRIEPRGVLLFDSISMTGELFKLEKARGSLRVNGRSLIGQIDEATLHLQGAKAMKSHGKLTLTTGTIAIDKLVVTSPNGGRVSLSSSLPLDKELKSSYTQLPHWLLLRTIIANLERQEKPLTAKVLIEGIPATIFSGHRGLPIVTNGTISGNISASALARLDGFHDIETKGALRLENVFAHLGDFRINKAYGDIKLNQFKVEAMLTQSDIIIPGQKKLTGKGTLLWTSKKGLDISKFQLTDDKGEFFTLKAQQKPNQNYPNTVDLKLIDLAVGPDLPLAPKLGGLPLVGRLSVTMSANCHQGTTLTASTGRLKAHFVGSPGSLFPLDSTVSLWQEKEKAGLKGHLLHKESNATVHISADIGGNKESTVSFRISSMPLDVYQKDSELRHWRVSCQCEVTSPQPMNEYPIGKLFSHLPNRASILLKDLTIVDSSGNRAFSLDESTTLKYVKDRALTGKLKLHCYSFPITVELSKNTTLSLDDFSLLSLWKSLFPNAPFLKPKGKFDLAIVCPALHQFPTGNEKLSGELNLLDGGVQRWCKSGTLISCLDLNLPDLHLSFGGTILTPTIKTRKDLKDYRLSFELGDHLVLNSKELPINWIENAPVEKRILNKGELTIDGTLSFPVTDEDEPYFMLGPSRLRAKGKAEFSGENLSIDSKLLLSQKDKAHEFLFTASSDSGATTATLHILVDEEQLTANLKSKTFPLGGALVTSTMQSHNYCPGGLWSFIDQVRNKGGIAVLRLLRQKGSIAVNDLEISAAGLKARAERPFSVTISPESVTLKEMAMLFDGHRFKAHGHFSPDGPCNLEIISDGVPLQSLLSFFGVLPLAAKGTLTAQLIIGGKMPVPSLKGSVKAENASIAIPNVKQRLTLPSIEITSRATSTILSAVGLTWGEVPINFNGTISPFSNKAKFKLTAQDLPLSIGRSKFEGLTIDSSAEFSHSRKSFRFVATCGGGSIALPNKVPTSSSKTTIAKAEKFLKSLGDVDATLTLDVPKRVRIFNSFISADVVGSAKMTTLPSPAISARVELIKGHLTLHRHEFDFTSGVLTISGPLSEIKANLILNAETTVNDYTVNLTVAGDLDEPSVNLTSIPPLPEANIVELLTTGVLTEAATTDAITSDIKGTLGASAKDYLASSALNDVLFAGLGLGTFSVRTTNEKSIVRVRRNLGRRLRFAVDRVVKGSKSTTFSFELGLNKNLFIEGKTDGGNDEGNKSGTYLGLFRSFRFR